VTKRKSGKRSVHILEREDLVRSVDDSMSCLVGKVLNGEGGEHQFYTVTDTGAAEPLIQEQYAKAMGLVLQDKEESEMFSIEGAGGGVEVVRQFVELHFSLVGQEVKSVSNSLKLLCDEEPVTQEFRLRFSVIKNLAVPSLWGGPDARGLELTVHEFY
jgi:hypothetical protein